MAVTGRISVNIDSNNLKNATEKGMLKGLHKASAYLMTTARRKIRYTKYSHSKPGNPPHQHSKGKMSFRHSIRYNLDSYNLSSYIGPIKKGFWGDYSVPNVLEFGGMSNVTTAPWWYQSKYVPHWVERREDIATWLLQKQRAPLFMASNPNIVIQQRTGLHASSVKFMRKVNPNHGMFKTPMFVRTVRMFGQKPKRVYFHIFPISTSKQALKAADNIIKYFGYPKIGPYKIDPRPFMRTTVQQNLSQVLQKFNNVI